jgi:hypothetical protein
VTRKQEWKLLFPVLRKVGCDCFEGVFTVYVHGNECDSCSSVICSDQMGTKLYIKDEHQTHS